MTYESVHVNITVPESRQVEHHVHHETLVFFRQPKITNTHPDVLDLAEVS